MDRRVSILVVSAVLAAGIIGFMLLRVWGDLLSAIGHWNPLFIVPAIAFSTAGWWLRGARYRSILGGLGVRAGLAFSTACVLISQTANLVIPARLGDLVRVFILKHEGLSGYQTGVSSIVIERFFDILTVAILGLVALPFILGVPPWVYPVIILPLGVCGAFVVILLSLGRLQAYYRAINRILVVLLTTAAVVLLALYAFYGTPMWIFEILPRLLLTFGISAIVIFVLSKVQTARRIIARINTLIIRMLGEIKGASLSLGSITGFSGLSLVIWGTDILTTLSVAAMFQARVNLAFFAVVILAVVVGNLFKAVPVTPGGIGTYEAAVAVILVLSGTSQASATLIAVSDHLVKNVITAAGGVLSIRLLGGWVVDAIRDAFHGKGEPGA
jgi:uncharacterized membrane protein YbhN (UPF0104 family)